jgi:hypothetical protein
LMVWEYARKRRRTRIQVRVWEEALVDYILWTVWVGDVMTRKLRVFCSQARMGDVIGLAGPGQDT